MKFALKFDEGALAPSSTIKDFSITGEFQKFAKAVRENSKKYVSEAIRSRGFDREMISKLFHGKMTRSRLVYVFGKSFEIPRARMLEVATCIELLHEASLVHDDIQDKQKFRRGVSTVWYEYSVSEAISWGDFLLSLAFEPLLNGNTSIRDDVKTLNSTIQQMLEGQNLEQSSAGCFIEARDYLAIAELKTGSLLELPTRLLVPRRHSHYDELLQACKCLGVAYQAENDLNDFFDGSKGIDFSNKISSLPFLELYQQRLKTNPTYSYLRIHEDEITKKEFADVAFVVRKLVDKNLEYFYTIYEKALTKECFNLLRTSLNKYFIRSN